MAKCTKMNDWGIEHMIRCSKCNGMPNENDVIGWKCNSCGKAFQVKKEQLHNILVKKEANPEKSLCKCPSCGNIIDDGKESIAWKCSCGHVTVGKLHDFKEEGKIEVREDKEDVVPDVPMGNLINCPECGKEISGKAKKCVHCGMVFVEEKAITKICDDCGKEVASDVAECPFCGCPFEQQALHKVGTIVKSKAVKKKITKLLIPIVILFLVVVIGGMVYNTKVVKPKKNEAQNSVTETIEPTKVLTATPKATVTPNPTPTEIPKRYETMYDLKEAVVNCINENYSDGSISYYVDEYTDNTFISFNDDYDTISNKEKGYGVYMYSQILGWDDTNKKIDFSYLYWITYASNSFLDYMYDCNCIFLANDGTRYSFPIKSTKQYEEDGLYYTEMCISFDKADYESLKLLYELSQKEGLSFQMDKTNNDDEYVNITLNESAIKHMRNAIEIYIDMHNELYNEST